MVAAELIVTDLAFGLMLGCVFSVVAHGLNIIWGVVKVVNIAHGEFIMLGAYGAYFLNLFAGMNPLETAPVDAIIGLFVGYAFYYAFLHRELHNKEMITLQSEMVTLAATFGLSLFISNLAIILFTGNPVGINPLMGGLYAPISFVIVVLGGPGKMWGSLVGGLTLGVVIDLVQAFATAQIAYAAAFLILIPVLVFRPKGILK